MPPLASWYGGTDELEIFLRNGPLSGEWRWRHAPAVANGQLAVGTYTWVEAERDPLPFSLDVSPSTATGSSGDRLRRPLGRGPGWLFSAGQSSRPTRQRIQSVFQRFGLPDRLA